MTTIESKIINGKDFFATGITLNYNYRKNRLRKLEHTLIKYQKEVLEALKMDLNKTHYEGFMTEFALVMSEINNTMKNLKKWMAPKRKMPALSQMPAKGNIYSEPFGLTLIMSPWNYPFQLSMVPLIAAVAAGNTVILKPSAYSKHTSDILKLIIDEAFEEGHVEVILGGREQNSALLDERFDYIFFTGSPVVGKLVMEKASRYLTPVTLELGGKSPCLVDENANVKMSAKKIAFGKILNAGQTCVAPDYALVHESIADDFIKEIISQERLMLKNREHAAEVFPKIINEKHLKRIKRLLEEETLFYQSEIYNPELGQIPFTVIKNPAIDSPIMKEEIFAPILPVITYKSLDEAFKFIKVREKPLALYLFTNDKGLKNKVVKEISYGGGCINDTIIHLASHNMPFGGVGNSGMGNYHGKYGFDTFSHKKTVLEKSKYFDMPIRYQPYRKPEKTLPMFLFKH